MVRGRRSVQLLIAFAVMLAVACGPAAPASSPAAPSAPAPAAPSKPAVTSQPAEAAKPADASKPAQPAAQPAAAPAGAPKRGGSLRIALDADFTTMDPHVSTAAVDRQVYQSVFNTLVRLDEKLGVQPELAMSWETPEPKTYIFKLARGVKFHDGTDFNAQAVKFNMERMKNLPKSGRKSEILEIESVDVVDDYTVKFNLNQPSAPLLATLTDRAGMMVSPKAAQEKGDDFARSPVGTGPFTFVEWVKDDHLTVKKNPSYWEKGSDGQPMPYLDEVVYRGVPDGTVRTTALRTGTVDVLDIPSAKDVASLKTIPELKTSEVPGLAFLYITLNPTREPFTKKELREAVAYAIDRDSINKVVYFNLAVPIQTPIPPSSWAYDQSLNFWKRDVEKAKQLLAAGGAPNGFEFTITFQNQPEFRQLFEVIQEQLKDVGITMKLEAVEFGLSNTRTNTGDYVAAGNQWSGRPDPDGNTYRYLYSKGEGNGPKFGTPELDEALAKTRATSDQAERKKLYGEAFKLAAANGNFIPLLARPEVKAMSQKVQGFVHVPDRMIRTKWMWLSS
jgi:peptide/nickel transport system substrate-binding protein